MSKVLDLDILILPRLLALVETSSNERTHALTSVPFISLSSTYAIDAEAKDVLLNLIKPLPGSASVVVVEYVNCAESPPAGKKSAIVVKSPELSKPNDFNALSAAASVNSADVIVFVLDTLKDLSNSSCCCCAIKCKPI